MLAPFMSFLFAAQATPPVAPPTLVAGCYFRQVDMSIIDPNDRDKLTPIGPGRLLAIEFVPAAEGSNNRAPGLKLHDPTGIFLGLPISATLHAKGAYGFVAEDGADKPIVVSVETPVAGQPSQRAVIARKVEGNKPPYMLTGRCLISAPANPDQEFEGWKTLQATREPEARQ